MIAMIYLCNSIAMIPTHTHPITKPTAFIIINISTTLLYLT